MISIEALLLYGCLFCLGLDSEKAAVFHRCVALEFNDVITQSDKDLKAALKFLILSATIMEEMQLDLIANPQQKLDYSSYEHKIAKYEPTIKRMLDDFKDTLFDELYNRRTIGSFLERLTNEGWKFFNVQNLNSMFAYLLEEYNNCYSDDEEPLSPHEAKKSSEKKYA